MMSEQLRILFVEDSKSDLEFIQHELVLGGIDFASEVVETADDFRAALENFRPDIILADYNLPSFSGITAFSMKSEMSPLIPFILISGSIGEDRSVELIKSGITDCVQKDKLFTLPVKVERALKELREQMEKMRIQERLVENERLLSRAQQLTRMGSWEVNLESRTVMWSKEMYAIYECDPESTRSKEEVAISRVHPEDVQLFIDWFSTLRDRRGHSSIVFRIIQTDSGLRYLQVEGETVLNERGEAVYVFGTTQDITEKKIAEQSLRESEARYKAIVDTTEEMIHELTNDGEIVWVNEAWKKNMKMTSEEVIGKPLSLFLEESYLPKFGDIFGKLVAGQKVEHLSCCFVSKENQQIFIEGEAQPLVKNGRITGSQAFLKNVTQQRKAEQAIIKERDLSNSIVNSLPGIVCLIGENGKFIRWNNMFESVSGYSFAEIQGSKPEDFFDVDEKPRIADKLRDTFLNGHVELEASFYTRSGEKLPYYFTANRIQYKEKPCAIVVGVDITEQKKTEQHLIETSNKLQLVFDTLDDSLWGVDIVNRKMLYISPGNEKICGYPDEAFIDNPMFWLNVVLNEDKPKFAEVLPLIQSGKRATVEYRITHANGSIRWMEMRMMPTLNEAGQVIRIDGISIDISERKKSEDILKKTLEELNNRYNELMQFNYIVSHNLRAPVANIIGLSGLLEMAEINDAEKANIIRHISQSTLKMDELIKDLSQILSSRSALNAQKDSVSIPAIIYSICETLEKEIIQSGINIKTSFGEGAREIFSIKGYLESIIYNLISNALKYRSVTEPPEVLISTELQQNMLVLKVADNGIGIDLNKHGEYMFGLYKRFHFEKEGKGLGLHMTKVQVESLGGTIAVESTLDKGTEFCIKLPIQ